MGQNGHFLKITQLLLFSPCFFIIFAVYSLILGVSARIFVIYCF